MVGCGTMGTFVAWYLNRLGADVVVFERFGLGHEYGAYSGETRIYRKKYVEGPEYDELLEFSGRVWDELSQKSDAPLYTLSQVVSIGALEGGLIARLIASEQALGNQVTTLSADELRPLMHGIKIDPNHVGVVDTDGGLLRPEGILAAMWQELADAGVEIREWSPVAGLSVSSDCVDLRTCHDAVESFDKVVVTAGAWTNELLGGAIPRVDVQRLAVHWYPIRPGADMSSIPIAVIDQGFDFCVWPSIDGVSVKVGLNLGVDRPGDLHRIDKTLPDDLARFVDSIVGKVVPGAYPRAIRQAVQLESWSADKRFILGASGISERVIIGAGFSAHGFKMAPAIGRALASLACDVEHGFDLSPFNPNRFAVNCTIDEYVNGGRSVV